MVVLAMVNGVAAQRNPPCYDNFHLDRCGITFGFGGVCHQIANRILFTGGTIALDPFVLSSVRGLTKSTAIYGTFGRTRIPMMERLLHAYDLAEDAEDQSELEAKWTYRDSDHNEIREKIINALFDSKAITSTFRLMILDELYGTSTMLGRINTIFTHKLRSEFTEEIKRSIKIPVDELDSYLDDLVQESDAGKLLVDNTLITEVNKKIQKFDNSLLNLLGAANYKKVFGNNYDPDFIMCEPMLDSD